MSKEFDLDVTFEEGEPDISYLTKEELEAAVSELPEAIRDVAKGVLVDKETMSHVSQDLGIRQAELVMRLHRAKLIIANSKKS